MKILKMFNDWSSSEERNRLNSYGGCGYYRTIKVAEQLTEHEITVWGKEWHDEYQKMKEDYEDPTMVNEYFFSKIFREYDIVWLHYVNNPIQFAWMRVSADKYNCKLVMDIDDNFLEIDSKNPAKKSMSGGQYKAGKKGYTAEKATKTMTELSTILSLCDAVTVSTLPLKNRLEEHFIEVHGRSPNIFVVPNANDIKDWNFTPATRKDDDIVIGYSGGLSHHEDLDMVLPAIMEVMEKYKNVKFQIIGQLNAKTAKKVFGKWNQEIRNRLFLISPTHTQPEYPKHLAEQGWSIGIAPLIESPFNESKSHIKWLEYSSLKIPTIASRVYPYYKDVCGIPTIKHMETGVLCEKDEWVDALSLLIEDEKLRKRLGEDAYKAVMKDWQYKDQKERILDVVSKF